MPTSTSLSIIVPAYNEEGNIHDTCIDVAQVAERYFDDYEILVFDDASQDQTSEIIKKLQQQNPRISLIQNPVNKGLGYNYRSGVLRARYTYAIMIPGDNEVVAESLTDVFKNVGASHVIITFALNSELRPIWRRRISSLFTWSLNLLFGLRVPYYNGPCVIRTDLARQYVTFTSSFAYMAIILIQLLIGGATYQEGTFALRARHYGTTKAFRLRNMVSVIKDILMLFWGVRVFKKTRKCFVQNPMQTSAEHSQARS